MKALENALINYYHGHEYLSFLGVHINPKQGIAEALADIVTRNATHAYGDIFQAIAVRRFSTEHKGFDKASAGQIMSGNYSSDVMRGQYIRPESETTCNEFTFAPGELQRVDIETFKDSKARFAFSRWAETVPEMKTETTIAYTFFTCKGRDKTYVGYMLVRARDRKVLRYHAVGERMKNETVMASMRALLSSEGVEARERVATWSAEGLSVYDPAIFGLLKARDIVCSYKGPIESTK